MLPILEQTEDSITISICLGIDAGQSAELPKSHVGARTSAEEHRIVRIWILGHDALDVSVNGAVHRPVESFACLHSAIEYPTPR